MIGGKLAAQTIHELFARGDFSEQACAAYHQRWMKAFGRDFAASAAGARMVQRVPLFLDAANVVAQRKGEAFMAEFGAAMTGVKPKTTFLRPSVALPLGIEVVRQVLAQRAGRERDAYAARACEETSRPTSFQTGCLIDPRVVVARPEPVSSHESELEAVFRHAGEASDARRVVVLYGSEYGFARQIAHALCAALAQVKAGGSGPSLSARCVSMADHEIVDWSETRVCLLVCSTSGDGVPPTAARPFFDRVGAPSFDVAGLRHATLALGDRAYPHFCRAGRALDAGFRERGATPLLERVEIDGEDTPAVEAWVGAICARLAEPDTWRDIPAEPADDGLRERALRHFSVTSGVRARPTREAPLAARLLLKRELTRRVEAADPEILHLELDVSDPRRGGAPALVWQPGDALGVLPSNSPDEVAAVLGALGRSGDEEVALPQTGGRASLREALTQHLDIKNLSHVTLDALLETASTPDERALAARLRGAAASEYRRERELQDLLRDFPAAARALAPETLASWLGAIRPRYYSIASSVQRAADRLSITVAVVRYASLGRVRTGLATTFLADRVRTGDRIPVFVQSNPDLRLPPPDAPARCVMIASGSGVAPFRAFLQELVQRGRSAPALRASTAGDAPHLLFFGGRHEERDFLYRDEWERLASEGTLRLFPAFAQSPSGPRQLEERVLEEAPLLWERMVSGDHFYVCGDATRMAGAVERALLEIVQNQGGRSPQQAKAFLTELARAGRLQRDVWPT
jgi:sulfite reductase (NADPH) flavoprotein alpha-component